MSTSPQQPNGETPMWENLMAGSLAIALLGYLVYALVHPEKF
ncbi:K(+)-transporting ATPase subunit F [Austwickia sp. TVS 96-490-7B]